MYIGIFMHGGKNQSVGKGHTKWLGRLLHTPVLKQHQFGK